MKYIKALIYLIIALLLVVGGIKIVKLKREKDANEPKAPIYPIVTKSTNIKPKDIILTSSYIGEVKNDKEVVINTKFSGKILKIKDLGQKVKKGEIVVSLDNSDLKAKLIELNSKENSLKNTILAQKINLNNAIASLKRSKKLLKVKMVSIEEVQNQENKIVTLKAQIKANQNSLKEIEANKKAILNALTYTDIKSPVDGIVSAKFFNLADNAFMGKPILKITPKKGNYISIALPKSYKETLYKEKIYPLTPLKASFNGVKLFKANIDDPSLVTGEKIDLNVILFRGKATLIPYDSILSIDNKSYIFIYKKSKVIPKEIHIIESGKEGVVIKENISQKILIAKPDILLKIKGGYPVKLAK
ncbi:MAG: hypothetical protein GXO02_01010 [Epsilonproteobacteria bacterium]|nr:hypothetical protein [Campylobacterota bacterium]